MGIINSSVPNPIEITNTGALTTDTIKVDNSGATTGVGHEASIHALGVSDAAPALFGESSVGAGVSGSSVDGFGIVGVSTNAEGVFGSSTNWTAVFGSSGADAGGWFQSESWHSLVARSASDSNTAATISSKLLDGQDATTKLFEAENDVGSSVFSVSGTGEITSAAKTASFDNLAPTTTKGDLVVHNGTDNIREPVGATAGHVLTVDSAQTSGMKWAVPPTAKLVAKARLTSAQTFTTAGNYQAVAFNTVDYDLYSGFTSGTGAKYTVQTGQAGTYLVCFEVSTDASNKTVNDEVWVGHALNGTNQNGSFSFTHVYATGSYALSHPAMPWCYSSAAVNDYFQAMLRPIANQKISHTNALFTNTIFIYKLE